MTARLPAWLAALTLAAGCAPTAPNPPSRSEPPTMSHSEIPEPPPAASSTPEVADTEDETDDTRFTCGRKHPSMLWIGAVGRPITLVAVTTISIEPPELAIVRIQVEGEAASELTLKKVDGAWCVWP